MNHNDNANKYKKHGNNNPKESIKEIKSENSTSNIFKNTENETDTTNNPPNNKDKNSFKLLGIIWSIQDFIQIVLATLTLFTLVFYIIFSSIQHCQTKKSFNYTRNTDSINDARFEEDFILRKNATEKELRAYIGIRDFKVAIYNPQLIEVSYAIINMGKTPAYNISVAQKYTFSDIVEDSVNNAPNIKHINYGNFLLGNNITSIGAGRLHFPNNECTFSDFDTGKDTVNLFIHLFYYDVFDKRHYTQACVMYFKDGNGRTCFINNRKYNSAD